MTYRKKTAGIVSLAVAAAGFVWCDKGTDPAGQALPAEGLIAYYSFSGNADDSGDSAFHGTVHGAALCRDRFGNDGKSYAFDGINDFIDCGKVEVAGASISISAWVRTTQTSEGWIVAKFEDGDPSGYGLQVFEGRAGFWNGKVFLRGNLVNASGVVADSTWHHVVGIQNETTSILYVDGVEVGRHESTPDLHSKHYTMKIGRNARYASAFFRGALDEIRIYNRVLSHKEILLLYDESGS